MRVIAIRNVHEALPEGMSQLALYGERRESRNGPVLVMPTPVVTVYQKPCERVLFHPLRDANPFFHFIESLWMLAGRNDVEFLTPYVKHMATFSDDGKTLHGAYGHRWRQHFGFDQLGHVIESLKKDPECRRQVVQMWDATVDLGHTGKDLPCNTQLYFTRTSGGALDMTVCCRSNDAIWGAYGANAVHFSMLQEYMAGAIGCQVGTYYQLSNNFHAYLETFNPLRPLLEQSTAGEHATPNPYSNPYLTTYPLMQTPVAQWQQDLTMFLDEGMVLGLRDPFFRKVAQPIVMAHRAYKEGTDQARFDKPKEILQQCIAGDWKRACLEWVTRRETKWLDNQGADRGE